MVFKNDAQLKAFLMAKCKNALIKSQERVYQIIDDFCATFYAEYDPVLYQRTYQLWRSLVKSDIVSTGNGYKAEVYFDLSGIDYTTGAEPSGRQVMKAAAQGLHGAMGTSNGVDLLYVDIGGGTGVWNDPIMQLNARAIDILVDMLIAEGIPVKRG